MPGEETGESPLKGCPPAPPHPPTDPVDVPAYPQQQQEQLQQDQKPPTPPRMSPEDAPSTSPLAGEEGPAPLVQQGPNATSSSTSAPSASPPATFNLTCMTCHTHFTSAELYTRHHCVASGTPVQDAMTESSSDVEKFDGKIVYNPDGSAYIFDSEMSDDDGGVAGLELPRHEGSIVDSPRHPLSTTASPTIPTIANAIYVTKNPAFYTALYGQTFTSLVQENKVPDVPIVHNYRVFTVGDKDSDNECKNSDSRNNSSSEKTKLPLLDYSQVPIKPILMCFVCKLSFGYVKSFIAHAMGDHSVVLVEEEKDLLASKNASAIIQCAGREEPRVSFLEPVIPPGGGGGGSGSSNDCSSSSSQPPGGPLATLLPSRAPSGTSPTQQPTSPVKAAHNNDAHQSLIEEGHTSIVKTEMSDFYEMVRQQQQHQQKQQQQQLHQQQQIHHHHQQQQRNDPFAAPQHPAAVRTPDLSRKSPISALGANGRASVSPVTSMSPTSFSPLQSPVTQLTGTIIGACPEHMSGRPQGVNCDKCDLILQQSRQLGGQMAFMHSRNSCKTLKCPKCNWHYKYQETLEIHMKEKHPDNESTCIYCLTNQPHPRLARGETYTCGYKPYRCEVCNYSTTTKGNLSIHMQSDKHLNNMQELQNGGMPTVECSMGSQSLTSQQQSPSTAIYSAPKTPTPCTTPSPMQQQQQQKPKPVWRCDVCNYETNVARNLRIHMTSEKHTHNMMVLQQNVKHMQQLSALQGNGGGGSAQMDPMAMLQYAGNPAAAAALMANLGVGEKPPMPEAALADLAYNQALLIQMMSGGQLPPGGPPLGHGHHMGHGGHMGLGGDQPGPHFDLGLNPESLEPPPEPVPPNPRHAFTCCVCTMFSTDSLEQLNLHLQLDRSKVNESEVLLVVAGNYICKLCSYKTNLKANFQLHCKTDKHLQKLQHVNHILEGGTRNEWKLKYLSNTNPMHVRCNLCEYYTNSVHKLQLHAAHQRHEVLNVLFRHLCVTEQQFMEDRRQYTCALCNFTTRAKLQLLHHIRSMRHLQMEQLHQIQRHAEGKGGTQQDIGEIFKVEELMDEDGRHTPPEEPKEEGRTPDHVHACPFCHFTCDAESSLQQHVDADHGGEKKAGLRCPLCEEACPDMSALEKHAVSVHSVHADGLQRLLLLVRLSAAAAKEEDEDDQHSQQQQQQQQQQQHPQQQPQQQQQHHHQSDQPSRPQEHHQQQRHPKVEENQPSGAGKRGDERNVGREPEECGVCGVACGSVEDLLAHQTATGHIPVTETSRGPGYLCWKKGCNQYFPTAQALHSHFREIHGAVPRPSVAVSERHVYKYRCQQCSLAFKTVEKLQLHAQYHAIRDATKCLLCHRNFRSLGALQKHVSADHPELTAAEKHQFQSSIVGAPVGAGAGPVLDPNTTALLRRESNKDDEVEEIPRVEEPPLPPHQQAIEDYLNSDTVAQDNYSDPARRYKCHRCRVAFTRQSYLTVHQKTLLHRRDDERGRDAEIVQGGEKGTSDEREKEAESGSRSDAAATPTSHRTPTPGVTPTSTTAPSVSPAADHQGMNVPSQMAEMAAALNALTAAQMQQMQFNPMMMAGLGLAGLPLQLNPLAAMNLHPPLMPMLPPQMFDPVALSNMQQQSSPTSGPSGLQGDPCMFLKQQQQHLMQQQQQHAAAAAAAAAAAQQKRARTRITDDQLKILRAHFDINNSPTEEQIVEMAKQSGLPPKVIKHWFRNTLFKERQRSKDSPYNFSIPPSTTLNLEEYEKTGEAKVMPLHPDEAREIVALNCNREEHKSVEQIPKEQEEPILDRTSAVSPLNKVPSFTQDNSRVQEKNEDSIGGSLCPSTQHQLLQLQRDQLREQQLREQREQLNPQPLLPPHQQSQPSSQVGGGSQLVSSASSSPLGLPATPSFTSLASPQTSLSLTSLITSQLETNPMLAHKLPHTPPTVPSSGLIPPMSGVSPTPPHLSFPSAPQTPTSSSSISGKRANRTRFTDYQIKVLQEFFENNAYPKDDDLEYLSKLLNLSPRVIVVWFQNARQKARKVYENQPPIDPNDEGAGRFTRTPGLNYQCKKCLLVFQRYYELIRHQKTHCFKEEDAKRSAQAQAAAAHAAALYQDENSNHSSITESSQQSGSLDNKSITETYQCDKCSLVFNRFEQWREHQIVHLMNPALFLNKGADSPFTSIQQQQQQSQPPAQQHQLPSAIPQPQPSPLLPPASPLKRKTDESEDERDGILGSSEGQRDKRLRTTILPEQLDYLYQKYQLEANPSRKMLETIAQEVGLKKRVVQVWFQNTRARERKGQFRAHAQVINKKCPFCPAIFKVKSALESHLSTKHADQYSKGDVDIDALPDVEDSGVGNFSLSSTPSTTQASQVMPSSFFSSPEVPEDSIAMYHEEAIRRYLNDVNLATDVTRREGESPLDLSKPLELVRPLGFDSSLLDTSDHLGDHSDEESYHLDVGEPEDGELSINNIESNPCSPASSTTSSARPGGHHSSASKRFRTQMSAIQVKIMKSVFRDYKTPTMAECELLGREIGLAKRVVQVWFQNARAKEKKAKLALQKMLGTEPEGPKPPEECKVCNFKYSHKYSVQDHLFTRSHIENMKMFLEKAKEESEVAGLTSSLSSMSAESDKQPSLTPAAGLAHQLQMAQLMALGSPPAAAGLTASDDRKVGPGGSNNTEDLSRLQLLQQMYQQMGLGGLQGAPHPLLQHAMMAGAGE